MMTGPWAQMIFAWLAENFNSEVNSYTEMWLTN
jgi:hypothetical protein